MTDGSELPRLLRAAYLAMHRQSDVQFARYGVTADQFVLLATLSHGDAMTQRDVARRMPSDPSTVRAMLILLEKQGLVQRATHPTDSRARTVALTTAGRRKFRQLWNAGETIRAQMTASLQPAETEAMMEMLKRIALSLDGERLELTNIASA